MNKIMCTQCGKEFSSATNAKHKNKRDRSVRRCPSCRDFNKKENKFIEEQLLLNMFDNENEKSRIRYQNTLNKQNDKPIDEKIQNLFIIGNGFDIWQNLPTKYSDFEKFYEKNKIGISNKLNIEPIIIEDEQKNKEEITQFDLLYFVLNNAGLPIEIKDFWNSFEDSLFYLDDLSINQYFGKELEDIYDLRLDSLYAHEILRECFCEWIKSIKIDKNIKNNYKFNNSLFINFNYTDTLVNRFDVCPNNIIHIHGSAKDKSSIIFGHGQKMANPDDFMLELGQRFKGLYAIHILLLKFYKKPNIQWQQFIKRLKNKNTDFSNVKTVFVLGHSLGKPDYYYFEKLSNMLPQDTKWIFSYYSEEDKLAIYELQKAIKFVNYELHDNIETIIKRFKTNEQ